LKGKLFDLFKINIIPGRLCGRRLAGWVRFLVTLLLAGLVLHLLVHFPEFLFYMPGCSVKGNYKTENQVIEKPGQ